MKLQGSSSNAVLLCIGFAKVGVLFASLFSLAIWSGNAIAKENNQYFKFITSVGMFIIPTLYAPIPKWREMIVPDIEGDNFVFNVPGSVVSTVSFEEGEELSVTFISHPKEYMRLGARCKPRPAELNLPDLCMKRISYKQSQLKYFFPAHLTKTDLENVDQFLRSSLDSWLQKGS